MGPHTKCLLVYHRVLSWQEHGYCRYLKPLAIAHHYKFKCLAWRISKVNKSSIFHSSNSSTSEGLEEKDPLLAQVKQSVMSVWPTQKLGRELHLLVSKHSELSVFDACVLPVGL